MNGKPIRAMPTEYLTSQALEVFNASGRTPSELLKERDEAVAVCEMVHAMLRGNDGSPSIEGDAFKVLDAFLSRVEAGHG